MACCCAAAAVVNVDVDVDVEAKPDSGDGPWACEVEPNGMAEGETVAAADMFGADISGVRDDEDDKDDDDGPGTEVGDWSGIAVEADGRVDRTEWVTLGLVLLPGLLGLLLACCCCC